MKRHPVLWGFLIVSVVAAFFFLVVMAAFSLMEHHSVDVTLLNDSFGVVEITGAIETGEYVNKTIREFAADDSLRAILVRIDSPGGVVGPTQEIYTELRKAAKKKPVWASLGSTAASGAFYIACAADHVVANPGTLTGSIGVLMEFITGERAFDKLGLRSQVVKSGKYKSTGNIGRTLSDDEQKMLQTTVDDVHRQFIEAVAAGRKKPFAEIAALADGRIFTGAQAQKIGLVDELGDFYDAVDQLKKALKISGKVKLVYPEKKHLSFLDYLIENVATKVKQALVEEYPTMPFGRLYFR
jgi:protease-4